MPAWMIALLIWLGFTRFSGPSLSVSFLHAPSIKGIPPMATALVGTVVLGPSDPNVSVTSRSLTVAINGQPAVVLPTVAPITFSINAGDTYVLSAFDTSAGGVKSPVNTLSGTAVDNVSAPAEPTLSVTFAPAPAPTPDPVPAP